MALSAPSPEVVDALLEEAAGLSESYHVQQQAIWHYMCNIRSWGGEGSKHNLNQNTKSR